VLTDPGAFRPLGEAARQLVRDAYSLEVCLPRMRKHYQDAAGCSRVTRPRRRTRDFALAGIAVG
jgi:hypothetical protein